MRNSQCVFFPGYFSIRCKTACIFIYKKYAKILMNNYFKLCCFLKTYPCDFLLRAQMSWPTITVLSSVGKKNLA